MRNTMLGMLIGGLLVALGMGVTHAQNPSLTPYQVTVTAKCIGNMNTSLAGQATYCQGIDGGFVSMNGSAPVQYAPPSSVVAGVQRVQGTAPGATGNVQLACTLPFPSTLQSNTFGAPISVACVGAGN
jgi:hypothetical protein